MTLSVPSAFAALTSSSIPPKSSAEVAVLASVPPLLLLSLLSSAGGEHAANAAVALSATRVTNQFLAFTRPPESVRIGRVANLAGRSPVHGHDVDERARPVRVRLPSAPGAAHSTLSTRG